MIEVLRRTQSTLSIVFSAGYADSDVLVTITDQAGNSPIVDSQAAVLDPNQEGRYTIAFPPQPEVNQFSVVWAGSFGGIDQSLSYDVEVVGEVLFTISELRQFGDRMLADETQFTDEALIATRSRITEDFARFCNVSFIPRYARESFRAPSWVGAGHWRHVWLANLKVDRVLDADVDGVPLDQDQIDDLIVYPSGKIAGLRSRPRHSVLTIGYQHGYEEPPAAITRAALILARYEMVKIDVAERMVTLSNDLGTIRLSIPGPGSHTGIPVVDETLNTYSKNLLPGATV